MKLKVGEYKGKGSTSVRKIEVKHIGKRLVECVYWFVISGKMNYLLPKKEVEYDIEFFGLEYVDYGWD